MSTKQTIKKLLEFFLQALISNWKENFNKEKKKKGNCEDYSKVSFLQTRNSMKITKGFIINKKRTIFFFSIQKKNCEDPLKLYNWSYNWYFIKYV